MILHYDYQYQYQIISANFQFKFSFDSLHSFSSGNFPHIPHGSEFLLKKGLALAHVPENLPFFFKITLIEMAMIDSDNKIRVTTNNNLLVYNVNFFF